MFGKGGNEKRGYYLINKRVCVFGVGQTKERTNLLRRANKIHGSKSKKRSFKQQKRMKKVNANPGNLYKGDVLGL